jgi:DNA-binding Xre family transcriptional regulator
MTDTRTALKNGLGAPSETQNEPVPLTSVSEEAEVITKTPSVAPVKEEKKRRGRPTISHKVTKIHLILVNRGLSRKDLYDMIKNKYPDEPISPDAVSRIVSGKRKFYSTPTLFRICGALNVTPNQVLDYERETI